MVGDHRVFPVAGSVWAQKLRHLLPHWGGGPSILLKCGCMWMGEGGGLIVCIPMKAQSVVEISRFECRANGRANFQIWFLENHIDRNNSTPVRLLYWFFEFLACSCHFCAKFPELSGKIAKTGKKIKKIRMRVDRILEYMLPNSQRNLGQNNLGISYLDLCDFLKLWRFA